MKKKAWLSILFAVICTCVAYGVISPPTMAVNLKETDSEIRVTIGLREEMSPAVLKRYNKDQEDMLTQFSRETPEDIGKALISFNRFLSVEQTQKLMEGTEKIATVYMWVPNRDGRAIVYVQDNDIQASVDSFFQSLNLSQMPASEMKDSLVDLYEDYRVFAVKVDDQYSQLQSMSGQEEVSYLDLLYSNEATQLAEASGKTVTYSCIPEKPDGTA